MRCSRLKFPRIYSLVCDFLKEKAPSTPKRRGRPRIFIALWLFQTLWRISYRETLETASKDGFSDYRVRKYPLNLLQENFSPATMKGNGRIWF